MNQAAASLLSDLQAKAIEITQLFNKAVAEHDIAAATKYRRAIDAIFDQIADVANHVSETQNFALKRAVKFVNAPANVSGTFRVSEITATPEQLVAVFGKPTFDESSADGKTEREWHLTFEDGTVAAVYDYKVPAEDGEEYEWSIGGKSAHAGELVHAAFGKVVA